MFRPLTPVESEVAMCRMTAAIEGLNVLVHLSCGLAAEAKAGSVSLRRRASLGGPICTFLNTNHSLSSPSEDDFLLLKGGTF